MEWSYVAIATVLLGVVQVIVGKWIEVRLQNSIEAESEQRMRLFEQALSRSGVLFEQRLEAFRALQKPLLAVKAYCEAAIGSLQGSEFVSRESTDSTSCLALREKLNEEFYEYRMLLTADSRAHFEHLLQGLSNGAAMELAVAMNESRPADERIAELSSGTEAPYADVGVSAEKCIQSLFGALKFPSEIV
jgi:hypothetical protein